LQIRHALAFFLCIAWFSSLYARAQSDTVTVNSDLVMVSALVKSHDGERVYLLKAQDFVVLDNGIPQTLHLEEETGREPIALAIIVQSGGRAASRLKDYQHIETLLEDLIGDVPHTVAVIRFDSAPSLARGFADSIPEAAKTIAGLEPGDDGAAILDAVAFGIQQLKDVPSRYRRAVLLISETFDKGSQISLADAEVLNAARPDARYVVLPSVNHVLKAVEGDDRAANLAAYSDPDRPLAPGVTDAVVHFIAAAPGH